ncbi:MAG: metallophosphoesterase family protein [Chitinophagaceae bacterium]|nr:metallophosphoesterase family protein [Chitinophagaceae bacterium]
MMKRFFFSWLFLFLGGVATAQNKSSLRFNASGEFKIIQFTDTHVNVSGGKNLGIFEYLKKIIETEKPDLVVVTGDIVTENNPQKGYMLFDKAFREVGVPWVMVFGNHDSENNFSRKDLADFLQSRPGCLNKDAGETEGNSNFILTVSGKDGKDAALLYFMDSNAYSTLKPQVDGWGWFTHNQVSWYRTKSKAYTTANGGTPYPALAFFHIPFPEYELAMQQKNAIVMGKKREPVCAPEINTGMFAAMLESGDVMGTFAGHDHYNDYIVTYYDIALAYGRASKLRNQENPNLGGRVIVLKEGKREFDTWIRDMHGAKEQPCTYPGSFTVKK